MHMHKINMNLAAVTAFFRPVRAQAWRGELGTQSYPWLKNYWQLSAAGKQIVFFKSIQSLVSWPCRNSIHGHWARLGLARSRRRAFFWCSRLKRRKATRKYAGMIFITLPFPSGFEGLGVPSLQKRVRTEPELCSSNALQEPQYNLTRYIQNLVNTQSPFQPCSNWRTT